MGSAAAGLTLPITSAVLSAQAVPQAVKPVVPMKAAPAGPLPPVPFESIVARPVPVVQSVYELAARHPECCSLCRALGLREPRTWRQS